MQIEPSDITVDVYARPVLFLEPIDSKIETLQRMEATGAVGDLRFHSWPAQIPLSSQSSYDDAIMTYERFKQWADANGVQIEPPFDVEIQRSTFTDEEATVLKTPLMALALKRDERLVSVFPHTEGAVHYSVTDALGAIETGSFAERNPPLPDAVPRNVCPHCSGALVNVQGVSICHDCGRPTVGDQQNGDEDRVILQPTA